MKRLMNSIKTSYKTKLQNNMKLSCLFPIVFFLSFMTFGQKTIQVEPVEINSNGAVIRDFTMSASGQEAYVTLQSPLEEISVLVRISKSGNKWKLHSMLPFSGKYKDLEPVLSKDNLRLYFASNRPLSDTTALSKDYDIWYVERESMETEWGAPINMGEPINSKYNEFYPSVSENNNLYFTSDNPISKGKDDIFFSRWNNDRYMEPISLSNAINTDGYEFNAYVSSDESFLIFSGYNREDGMGSGDLYISFRDDDHIWTPAVNLGKGFNSKHMDYCPFIDQHSMTMYFTSKRSTFKLTNNFKSIDEVIQEVGKSENGLSSIFRVQISDMKLLIESNDH